MFRILLAIAVLILPLTAQAEDTPAMRDMYREIAAFAKKLNDAESQHFYLLYNNFNMIKSVGVVRGDISKAVDSCSDNNPEMENKMRTRFKSWSDQVDPAIDQANAKLNNMVDTQHYADPKEIRHIFDLVEQTRDQNGSEFKKTPVTTPEACDYLLDKMDSTQDGLMDMLKATLIDYPEGVPVPGEGPAPDQDNGLTISPPPKSKNN